MSPLFVRAEGRGRNAPADRLAADRVAEWYESRRQIAHVWCVEDVQRVRPDLGADESWRVLQRVDRQKDAGLGITWDTLTQAAEALYPEPPGGDAE